MEFDPSEDGHCAECGDTLLWGGTGWVPHTPERHVLRRARLVRSFLRQLQARAAGIDSHTVVIRFTSDMAWAECSCGWRDIPWPDSAYARRDGHDHLGDIGGLLVRQALLRAAA